MFCKSALQSPYLIQLPFVDYGQIVDEMGAFVVQRVLKGGLTGGVMGLSGGVDSTVTAAVTKRGFDKYNATDPEIKLELVGMILSSEVNSPDDERDGAVGAGKLGIRCEKKSIEPHVDAFLKTHPWLADPANKFHLGNCMSRIRANCLHTKAAMERKLVVGTGNWAEDFCIGYYTLFGDGAVMVSPLGNLSKRLVQGLAVYFGFENIARREPTAGLEPGQTDFGDLGYSYDTVELVFEGLRQGVPARLLHKSVQVRNAALEDIVKYERLFGRRKFNSPEEIVADMQRRYENSAKWKAEILHPPAAPVTLRYPRRPLQWGIFHAIDNALGSIYHH